LFMNNINIFHLITHDNWLISKFNLRFVCIDTWTCLLIC
jgi:hypothetical protein